ncbi:hypothetical protein LJ739_11485 [Aestuariibacter halophilus]|uniref:Uncharacterized protein n=1 Tax=Fluctibacter halophilus TaxID=226011 RepID=A0ABS8G8K0_9ALTE|nr:hypothetical protein [Aestuariibacter halophilus]MCC2616865.1 hypothetical protein [Aestuariibacter halophilus]
MTRTLVAYALTVLFGLSAVTASANQAPDPSQSIISKVINAYGGTALTHAKTVRITDYNKGPWPGESENPGVPELWRINEILTIDLAGQRKSLLSYRVPRTTVDLEKWLYDGEKTIKYDILHNKYTHENWASYDWLGGSMVRASDTMHALGLHNDLQHVKSLGDEYYRGKLHHRLDVTLKKGGEFVYFIDATTGLISKVQRKHPSAELLYVFSNHQQQQGVVFAADMNFFVNGALRLTSVHRDIEVDQPVGDAFEGFDDYSSWGETLTRPEDGIRQLGNHTYQVGEGRSMTVFYEHDNSYSASGEAADIAINFEALKRHTGRDKPLTYFIVSHHHRRNLSGLGNVLQLGAKLVVAGAHKATVLEALPSATADNLVAVPDRQPYLLGYLTLFDIATAHSQHYLLTYVPDEKMVVADDHYETDLKSAKPRIHKDMVLFRQQLEELEIDIETLIDTRSWRTFSIDELRHWTDSFEEKRCPAGYDICASG